MQPKSHWVYPSTDGVSSGSMDPSHATPGKSQPPRKQFVHQKHTSKEKKKKKGNQASLSGLQAQQLQKATTGRGRN